MISFNLRVFLSNPHLYSGTMRLLGNDRVNRIFVDTYVRPEKGDALLDIGCGPADILNFLPDVKYYGFDIDAGYIDAARKRYGKRGTFYCTKVSTEALEKNSQFDVILAKGLLHHLDNAEAADMFELAKTHLKTGGRLITFDGCYEPGQNYFAKKFLEMDRGRFIRSKESLW